MMETLRCLLTNIALLIFTFSPRAGKAIGRGTAMPPNPDAVQINTTTILLRKTCVRKGSLVAIEHEQEHGPGVQVDAGARFVVADVTSMD
jgi:hypothetical protein